jgi:hypothetical protein
MAVRSTPSIDIIQVDLLVLKIVSLSSRQGEVWFMNVSSLQYYGILF